MKILCHNCKNDITREVISSFSNYHLGYVKCSSCHKQSKRYISEFDCWLYFLASSFIFFLGLISIVCSLTYFDIFVALVIIGIALVILYKLLTNIIYVIYDKAPFKSEFKTYNYKQNQNTLRYIVFQKYIFILLTFYLTSDIKNLLTILIIFAFMIVYGLIKLAITYKKEVKFDYK